MRASGAAASHGAVGGFAAYTWRAETFEIGGQTEVRPGLTLSGALAYEDGRMADSDHPSQSNTQTGMGLVGLRYRNGPWTFEGVLDGAAGSDSAERSISLPSPATMSANTTAFNVGGHLRGAYTLPFDAFYIEPEVMLEAIHVGLSGYTETGTSPFNLRVSAIGSTIFVATPGVRVGSRFQLGPAASAEVYAGAGLSLFTGNAIDVSARFASVPGSAGGFHYTLYNDTIAARFIAGTTFHTAKGIDLDVAFQGVASGNETILGGEARFIYHF